MSATKTAFPNATSFRLQFFDFIFAEENGQLCIAIGNSSKQYFKQTWFNWPEQRNEMGNYLEKVSTKYNVWYGVTLFSRPERKREWALPGKRVWADLDLVDPKGLELPPSAVVESSKGRFQGIWALKESVPPDVAQDWSRKLAYHTGADKSGWDLEQLLRVPFSYNLKYEEDNECKLLALLSPIPNNVYFEELSEPVDPTIQPTTTVEQAPLPEDLPDISSILYSYHKELNNPLDANTAIFADLREREPTTGEDWSGRLWRLINICFEVGMTEVEAYVIAESAACNKYYRDNRPISYMWKEVLKAKEKHNKFVALVGASAVAGARLVMPMLVDPNEVEEDSFVAEYKAWANEATDAPEQYHEVSCFIALSACIANGLSLSLKFSDNFRPNLWALVLGDSTLSRKTTSMRMAMDLLSDLDSELILASDGSAEGLLTGLSGRPKRVSIFYKDEVSGFFDSINRKDYLAGFPETLTQLYDVPKVLSRLLRKETITVTEPYFIFFGGGIRDKVFSLINDDYILSGFLPRFIVVSSDNDITRIRRTGPPTSVSTTKKDALVNRLTDLKERYGVQVPMMIGTQTVLIEGKIEAHLTQEAWDFFGDSEELLQKTAFDSPWQMLALPTLSRMAFSMLKMSMLVAASRKPVSSSNRLEIDITDMKQAAYYIQKWGQNSLDLIMASGKSANEKKLENVLTFIRSASEGVTQTQIMQRFHMTSKEMRELRDTLADRGLVTLNGRGRGWQIKALEF